MNRVELAETCARMWSKLGLNWVALHGLEGYPDELGRDIDILVAEEDSPRMIASAVEILENAGWRVARPPDIWGRRVLGFGEGEALELHTVTRVDWRELDLVVTPRPTEMEGPFPVDPWASLVKQVVLPAFAGEVDRAARVLESHDLEAVTASGVNSAVAGRILGTLDESADATDAVRRLTALRKELVRLRWIQDPLAATRSLGRKAATKALPLIRPSGLRVPIAASDDGQLAAILDALDSGRRSVFTAVRVRRAGDAVGGRRKILTRIRDSWSDRRIIGQQAIVFYRWLEPSAISRALMSLGGLSTVSPIPIFLDFSGGARSESTATILYVADEPIDRIVDSIWHIVEDRFATAYAPKPDRDQA